jgi:intein/homing endonuclease
MRGRKVILPEKIDLGLAELIGIHFGDGNLYHSASNYNYQITYAGNLKEEVDYMLHIENLFTFYFGVKMTHQKYKKMNSYLLRVRSKEIFLFMNKFLEIPIGPKNSLSIPSFITKEKSLSLAFIRGLFDTDGCIIVQRDKTYRYVLVKISTKCEEFAKEISNLLLDLKFSNYICKSKTKYDIVIRSKVCVENFFNEVKPNNLKKVNAYKKYMDIYYGLGGI